eukprot:143609_1
MGRTLMEIEAILDGVMHIVAVQIRTVFLFLSTWDQSPLIIMEYHANVGGLIEQMRNDGNVNVLIFLIHISFAHFLSNFVVVREDDCLSCDNNSYTEYTDATRNTNP